MLRRRTQQIGYHPPVPTQPPPPAPDVLDPSVAKWSVGQAGEPALVIYKITAVAMIARRRSSGGGDGPHPWGNGRTIRQAESRAMGRLGRGERWASYGLQARPGVDHWGENERLSLSSFGFGGVAVRILRGREAGRAPSSLGPSSSASFGPTRRDKFPSVPALLSSSCFFTCV